MGGTIEDAIVHCCPTEKLRVRSAVAETKRRDYVVDEYPDGSRVCRFYTKPERTLFLMSGDEPILRKLKWQPMRHFDA